MADPAIIRNRAKINATIDNARALPAIRASLARSMHTSGASSAASRSRTLSRSEMAPTTPESIALSKDLQRCGFRFVGTTICYAFMEAAGLVNDHVVTCFRYRQVV